MNDSENLEDINFPETKDDKKLIIALFMIGFALCWVYLIINFGWFWGLLLGWMPSILAGFLTAWLFSFIALVIFPLAWIGFLVIVFLGILGIAIFYLFNLN